MTLRLIRPSRVFYPSEIIKEGNREVQAISYAFMVGDFVTDRNGKKYIVRFPGYYADAGLEEVVFDDELPYAEPPKIDG